MSGSSRSPGAIQLIFENDLKSPIFDSRSTRADKEFKTVDLTGQNVTKIKAHTDSESALGNFSLHHENGS